MRNLLALLLAVGISFQITSGGRCETLKYAVFPAPPFMILDKADAKESYTGIDVDIVQELARRMALDVRFVSCPWVRCLRLLQDGKVDLLSSAYKKPEREVFLDYLENPYLDSLKIAFYYKNDKKYSIEKYEDLYEFKNIGVLRNASYFDRFDKDDRLSKFEVTTQDRLFPMLMHERLDLIAGYVPTENYRLIAEGYKGKIQKSTYEVSGEDAVYLALSKKSALRNRLSEFNMTINALIREGFVKNTIDSYYNKYSP
jgi:polar amino acid transport system substrate-binding protein